MMEEMNNNLNSQEKSNFISTLIFMDLEATGLPSFVGKKNVHITEISLIAIDRQGFENDKSQRVLNKLSLCVRPRAEVSPGAMSITGLYNDNLENQEIFDETVPKLLKYFFRRLRTPVCLLAHNGRKYDFPLLQAELKRVNYSLGPDVFCVDTLEALRSILNSSIVQNPVVPIPTELPIAHSEQTDSSVHGINKKVPDALTNDQDIESLLSEDMDIFNDIQLKLDDVETELTTVVIDSVTKDQTNSVVNDKCVDMAYRNEHTPTSKYTEPGENVPKKRKKPISDPLFSPKRPYNSNGYKHLDVRRRLFVNSEATPKVQQKMSFSLPKLYYHFFGKDPPISHYAEADCIALSEVCQQVCPEFLDWVDKNSSLFDEIKEMW